MGTSKIKAVALKKRKYIPDNKLMMEKGPKRWAQSHHCIRNFKDLHKGDVKKNWKKSMKETVLMNSYKNYQFEEWLRPTVHQEVRNCVEWAYSNMGVEDWEDCETLEAYRDKILKSREKHREKLRDSFESALEEKKAAYRRS